MRLVRNCNAAASSWRRAAVSASRAFFSLSLMISKIKSSRVARGMPSRSALRSIHSLHSPGARLARRFASAIARLAFSCESDFRLREIEHLLITAHDVDYLLSTERNLRRARCSLVGGRACEHGGLPGREECSYGLRLSRQAGYLLRPVPGAEQPKI
jgi:hypothetical protein